MGYDIEKECKKLGSGRYVWRRIFQYDAETFKNGSGKTKNGSGKV